MESYKNVLRITRGETFTLDKLLINKDGSPYIVGKLNNPYWLLSISNTKYSQKDRYIKNYWLPVGLTFDTSIPISLTDITVDAEGTSPRYTKFNDVTSFPIAGYYKGNPVSFDKGSEAVFYETDASGNKTYKYWNGNEWLDYTCRLIKTFLQKDTEELISQQYWYSIQLVSGITTREYLSSIADDLELQYTNEITNEELYNIILDKELKFPDNFDVNQPLGKIDTSYVILNNTNILVSDNIRGGTI